MCVCSFYEQDGICLHEPPLSVNAQFRDAENAHTLNCEPLFIGTSPLFFLPPQDHFAPTEHRWPHFPACHSFCISEMGDAS